MILFKIKDFILETYARIFAKKYFYHLNSLLFDLGLRGLGIMNLKDSLSGEPYLKDYLKLNYELKNVFDVGANVGNYARQFENSKTEVFCFEPHKETFEELKRNLSVLSNISFNCFGLSDKNSTSYLYDHSSSGSQQASIFKNVIQDSYSGAPIENEIELLTLDSYIEANSILEICLLKIDTEGNELNVLKGGKRTIDQGLIKIIQFEFNAMNVHSKVFFHDIIKTLPNYNFYRLLPNGFLPINYEKQGAIKHELFAYQNFVAFRKDIDLLHKTNP